MGVMNPQLSEQERAERWTLLQKHTIFPISTQWSLTVSATTYATVDASTLGQYTSNVIQQKTAYGIVGIRLTNQLATITGGIVIAVSYSPVFTVAATNALPNSPDDAGNVIYRAICNQSSYNEHMRTKQAIADNFFVEANRPIYIHQWASNAAITAANMTAQGFLTLYAELTGIRT